MGSRDAVSSAMIQAMARPSAGRRVAIREFFSALASPDTFNLGRNIYIVIGFLFGLPIPFFSVGIDLLATGRTFGVVEAASAFERHPIHWFFAVHPLLFAVVFGAMGAVRLQKNKQIDRLVDALETKVRALAAANEQLKDLDRLKSEFLANVSHELRTPLVSISGYTEMIAQGRLGGTTAEQREALAVMGRNIERLIRLIEELLELGRMDANRTRFIHASFDLREAAQAAAESLQPIFREKDLRFAIDGAEGPIPTLGDRDKIVRVFVNLLGNAAKFTLRGGSLGIHLAPGGRGVDIEVWDNGPGLSESDLRHLFERFWQGGDSRSRGTDGTGLGLAIVKEILDRHDTRIYAANRVDGGAQFRFRLPYVPDEGANPSAPKPPAHDGRAAAVSGRPG
jgi:signal transduction histidine kinase